MLKRYNSEPTLGDGNCAFNAFVLGLCKPEVLAQLQAKKPDQFAELRQIIHDANIQEADLSNIDKVQLQRMLSPKLREWAVSLIQNAPAINHYHCKVTGEQHLRALLDIFLACKDLDETKRRSQDDTYLNHDFIRAKFLELKENSPEEANRELLRWWKDKGHSDFLQIAKQSAKGAGDLERWGSEIELAILGQHLGLQVNIVTQHEDGRVDMNEHFDFGIFDDLSNLNPALTDLLLRQEIIEEKEDGHVRWKKNFTEDSLRRRLNAVPGGEDLEQAINACYLDWENPQTKFPLANLPPESIPELVNRGAIQINEDDTFNIIAENLGRPRIFAVGRQAVIEEIIQNWRINHIEPAAVLNLQNPGGHWSNLRVAQDHGAEYKKKKHRKFATMWSPALEEKLLQDKPTQVVFDACMAKHLQELYHDCNENRSEEELIKLARTQACEELKDDPKFSFPKKH